MRRREAVVISDQGAIPQQDGRDAVLDRAGQQSNGRLAEVEPHLFVVLRNARALRQVHWRLGEGSGKAVLLVWAVSVAMPAHRAVGFGAVKDCRGVVGRIPVVVVGGKGDFAKPNLIEPGTDLLANGDGVSRLELVAWVFVRQILRGQKAVSMAQRRPDIYLDSLWAHFGSTTGKASA